MQKCRVCGSSDFYKEAGYFFCQICQTQNEDVREEVFDLRVDPTTRLRKTRIRRARSDKSGEELGWTTWELYNFVLIGLTNELIELGVPPDIKLTILQLWATYLGKVEVAFISTKKKCVPKLARRYNKRDAEIIYGKVQVEKRSRRSKRTGSSTTLSLVSGLRSEGRSLREINKHKKLLVAADYDRYIQSQTSTEADGISTFSQSLYSVQSSSGKSSDNEGKLKFSSYAKEEINKIKRLSKNITRDKRMKYKQKHVSTQYKTGPHVITPMRLWAILYLALRIHNQPIHLGDMLRYGREGHLSYYKLDHLLPPEVVLTKSEVNFLSQNIEITHKGMRRIIASMAKFLGVWKIVCPDFQPLVVRYCQELALPRDVQTYTERLIALSPPKMKFDSKKSYIPNYEGRVMAFIIVVLKVLLGLDGITEYQISRVAEEINRLQYGKGCPFQQNVQNVTQDVSTEEQCKCEHVSTPRIIVHGGAGSCGDDIVIEKITACKKAAASGYKKLINGESAVEAVEAALWWLECDEIFNSGYGSALNEIGKVQMDASIMDGLSFSCGSVAAVSDIEHPISLAKYIMKYFPNSIFVGDGAKKVAQHANLNWISEGNMIAPIPYLTFKSHESNNHEYDYDHEVSQSIETLKNSFGTVGCVAYDGCGIAAGTTTGGLNRKLVGRVGDSSILGCGTYANRNVGCSLTGHGESIIKLGLSRAIVEDIEHNSTAQEALEKNLCHMLDKFKQTGGGIVLQENGSWASYSTSNKMPYAVIEDGFFTYGADINEKKRELYYDYNVQDLRLCSCFNVIVCAWELTKATNQGLLDSKLFNFQDWQKYIECRKTILIHSHFPTKLKYSCDTHGIDSLYIKFLDFINSKRDREEPEITNHKHFLPEELVSGMKKYMYNITDNDVPMKEINIFPASLTPLHSYLQQLLNDPLHNLPRFVQTDFFFTKAGYMLRPYSLKQLAAQCNIELDIIDSNVHFIEKVVPPFEQPRMPSIDELKELVQIRDDANVDKTHIEKCENLNDYVHRKIPCKMKLDGEKQQYYDKMRNSIASCKNEYTQSNYAFDEILPDGRLAIPSDGESDNEDERPDFSFHSNPETELLKRKFCEKYNLHLSQAEKESIRGQDMAKGAHFKTKTKLEVVRDAKGQFVKVRKVPIKMEESIKEDNLPPEIVNFALEYNTDVKLGMNDIEEAEDESLLDVGIDFETICPHTSGYINLSQISLTSVNIPEDVKEESTSCKKLQFFRPFKDYWIYHCIFSRVKPKNFELFEKFLPRTFRWLLDECSQIVEMSAEDLYEEVCLVENYHASILKSDAKSGVQTNLILNKW